MVGPGGGAPQAGCPPGFLGSGPRLWGDRRVGGAAAEVDSRVMTSHLNLATLLADSTARHPERPALVAGDTTIDYATLDAFARRFAGALADLGVRPGEHVALLLPNVPQFTAAYFGAHYAGTPVVPLNVLLTADELAYHLEDSQAAVVVAWEGFLGPLQEAVARVGTVRHVLVARADPSDLTAPDGCRNLVASMAAASPVAIPHPTAADDTAVVLYTSGTTGRPKGAELTHANLLSNARASAGLVDLDETTVALVVLPLFHAFGMTVMHNAVLAVGGSLVLVPRFQAADGAPAPAAPPGDVPGRRTDHVHGPPGGGGDSDRRPLRPPVVRVGRGAHAGAGHGRVRGPLRRDPARGLRAVGDVARGQLHRPRPAPDPGIDRLPPARRRGPAGRRQRRRRHRARHRGGDRGAGTPT